MTDLESEARAAAEKRYPITAEVEMDTNYFRRLGQRDGYAAGYLAGAQRPTGETHDEDTLRKVYDALMGEAGLSQGRAEDVVNVMQNAGILFRERAVEDEPKQMLMTHPHDGHGPNDTCLECASEPAPADEREALARVISYKGYPSIGDYEEADAILAAGFHLHPPQPIQHAWVPNTGPNWVAFCGDPDAKPLDPPPETAADHNAIPICTLCHKKAMAFAREQERNRHPQTIPIYAMLDVWMALHDTSHPEFDTFYAEHGYAETWARLMHAIRHPQPTEGEPTDAQCVRIANMAQEITGRSIWPSTVRAVLEAARATREGKP